MKNYLAILMITCFAYAQSNAVLMIHPEDIQELRHALMGKTIEQPREMVSKWLAYRAESLSLGSSAMTTFSEQFKDEKIKKAWDQAAQAMKLLSQQFKNLPVPNQKLEKSFVDMDTWIQHGAERMQLKSEQMRIVADQITDKKAKDILLTKSGMASEMALDLKKAVQADA